MNIFTQNLTKDMNWAELIQEIEDGSLGRRYSDLELGNKTGINREGIYKIRIGDTKEPQQSTIDKLERGLNIKIDASDPEDISYKKFNGNKEEPSFHDAIPLNSYPIFTYIFAGKPEMLLNEPTNEYISVPYSKKENCFGIKVIGDSMNGVVSPGDIAFVDMATDLFDGCVVAVRLKTGEQIIKRYHRLKDERILLSSDNSSYKPLEYHLKEIDAMYRVVRIIKEV